MLTPGLYLVPTPIGNLEDITARAQRVLGACHRILAEDTRRTGILLKLLGVVKPLVSLHDHNERQQVERVLQWMEGGEALALVSDAGMPTISDPGFVLVREAVRRGIHLEALPGPCALVVALVVSGLPSDRFIFEGFLPRKEGKSRKIIAGWLTESRTVVFYESPFRVAKTLQRMAEILGSRPLVICRELTKMYEEVLRGDLVQLAEEAAKRQWKGEITLVLAGAPA